MSLILDGAILLICAIIIVKGIRVGFVRSLMGILKGIASLFAAYAFTPALGAWIEEHFVISRLSSSISDTLRSLSGSADGTYNLVRLVEEMPDALRQIVDRYGARTEELRELGSGITAGGEDAVGRMASYIAQPVAGRISTTVAFVLIFVGVFVALTLLTLVLDAIFHLPLLSHANRALGAVFGVIEAILFAYLFSFLTSTLMRSLGSVDSKLFGEHVIENSVLLQFFTSHNLLDMIGNVVK